MRSIAFYFTNAFFIFYSTNKSRDIASYYAKESSISNLKSIYLQNNSIVIKQKLFKFLEVEYFYLDLLENACLLENYIIFEKDVFYCDIYIFTQQIRRIIVTKEINKQLYLCLRRFVII